MHAWSARRQRWKSGIAMAYLMVEIYCSLISISFHANQ